MEDRISLYPGRVKLTPVSGQENTYDMERADEPTQVGTALSKANLLKDTTAALYGLGEGAVPDEVFQALPSRFDAKVGDILSTARTDLGDKWLLCNGSANSSAEYPDLFELFVQPTPASKTILSSGGLYGIKHYNGTWVAVGVDGDGCPLVCISSDNGSTWTQKTISQTTAMLRGIAYGNGVWAACGDADGSAGAYVYTATDPNGEWSESIVDTDITMLNDIVYANGTWVMVGYRGTDTKTLVGRVYSTTDATGDWTIRGNPSRRRLFGIAYADGLWVACGDFRETTSSSTMYAAFAISPDLESWQLSYLSGYPNVILRAIAFHDGVWLAAGSATSTSAYYTAFYTETPTGTWEPCYPWRLYTYAVAYFGSAWVMAGEGSVYTATDLSAAASVVKFDTSGTLQAIENSADTWIAVSSTGEIAGNILFKLPTISVDGVYTYIKAKE